MNRTTSSRWVRVGIAITAAFSALWFAARAFAAVVRAPHSMMHGSITHIMAAAMPEFMPHGYCYLWDPRLVWLHVISDSLITLSYYAIPVILVYFTYKHGNSPFNPIFWMFGGFILACGTTHLLEVWNVWHESYLLAGGVKAVTAALSVTTAGMLVSLVPRVITLPRLVELEDRNQRLEREAAERRRFDAPIDVSLRRKVAVGFAVAILLTLLIGFSSWQGTRRAEQDEFWVAHTYAVMNEIALTAKHVIEVKSAARGFASSGEYLLLERYDPAKGSLPLDEETLRRLTMDSSTQQARLDALVPQVLATLDFCRRVDDCEAQAGSLLRECRCAGNREVDECGRKNHRTDAGRGTEALAAARGKSRGGTEVDPDYRRARSFSQPRLVDTGHVCRGARD